MRIITAFKLTKQLVIVSVVCSFLSIFTLHFDLGEVYPFFTWKLYSQPLGTGGTYTEYRIYSKRNGERQFHRKPVKATSTFTLEEYVYTFNSLISNILTDSTNILDKKNKLLSFVKHVEPRADVYKIVAETYRVKDLANGITQYDTITVIKF